MQSIKRFHFRNDTSRPNKRNKIKKKLVSKEVQNLPMEHLEICRFFLKKIAGVLHCHLRRRSKLILT